MSPSFLIDTCTIVNFAVVERLELLLLAVREDAGWVSAVQAELRRSAQQDPRIDYPACRDWFGEPIDLDESADLVAVETIRLALCAKREQRSATKNLGEAQSIHVLSTRLRDAVFVTDDAKAVVTGRHRKIAVWTTSDVLRACYLAGHVGCPDAYELMLKMREVHARGVRVPRSHTAVCP